MDDKTGSPSRPSLSPPKKGWGGKVRQVNLGWKSSLPRQDDGLEDGMFARLFFIYFFFTLFLHLN